MEKRGKRWVKGEVQKRERKREKGRKVRVRSKGKGKGESKGGERGRRGREEVSERER